MLDPAGDPGLVALDADRHAVVHGDRQRLRAAHPAESRGQRDRPRQGPLTPPVELTPLVELVETTPLVELVGDRGEGLEGALQDPLGADVDPGTGGHLAVHRQAQLLEAPELLPVRPVTDEVGVRDQHPWRPLMGTHHADGSSGLHQEGLVVGVMRTHEWAPRVLIANSNLVGDWANWEEFRRLEELGLTLYGQMTA